MTAVLVMGDVPSTGTLANVSAVRIGSGSDLPGNERALFIEDVYRRLQAHGAVLVVYPEWQSGQTARLIQIARGVLATDRVAGIPLRLPPLALSLVADTLAFLAPYLSPGMLAGMAHRLPIEIISGAWVRSVSSLEHIDVPLKTHLASYLPGGFMVTAAPQPAVYRISGQQQVMNLDIRPAEPILLLVSNEGGDMNWLQRHLVAALRPSSVKFAPRQPLAPAFWGTQRYVEFVAFSGHPETLTHSLRSLVAQPCPWCGEPSPIQTCPFCGMSKPAMPQPQQQTSSPTPPGAPNAYPPAASTQPPHPDNVHVASSAASAARPGHTTNGSGPPSTQPTQSPTQPTQSPRTQSTDQSAGPQYAPPTRHP
jgi:hypothetical protein